MIDLSGWGSPADKDLLGGLTIVEDLIYYEGPLLSLYRDSEGNPVLFMWLDIEWGDEGWNRWLCLKTTDEEVDRYRAGKTGLREVVLGAVDHVCHIVDLDGDIEPILCLQGDVRTLPEDYVPEEGAMYV